MAFSFFCQAFSFLDAQERKCVRTVWQASARKNIGLRATAGKLVKKLTAQSGGRIIYNCAVDGGRGFVVCYGAAWIIGGAAYVHSSDVSDERFLFWAES